MYYPSKYNYLVQVEPRPGDHAWVLSNLFFGASTLVDKPVFDALLLGERDGQIAEELLPGSAWAYLLDRGFVLDRVDAEEQLIGGANLDMPRDRLAVGLQGGNYGFIISLHCNLACPYCFQKSKADSCGFLSRAQVDRGLEAIARCEEQVAALNGGKPFLPRISITGGEPLLRNTASVVVLDHLLERLEALGWPCSITTNGTELAAFASSHQPAPNCRNIQVTLDGPREIHDGRRVYRNGAPSFDRICEGLEAGLTAGWHMTLRVNLDMTNVEHLPTLARYVQDRGWPSQRNFTAYVSPVTDHGSLGGFETPKDEADLLEAVLSVCDRSPAVRQVFDIRHFRGFDYVERTLLHRESNYPVIYRCEAVMGMYIFDPRGDVHVCLEAAGDPELRVGTYDPQWNIDEAALGRWIQRNVLALKECDKCKVRFICAGGCTIESINHAGAPGCMPFLREMDTAWHYYARRKPELFA